MEHATCGREREIYVGVWTKFEETHKGEFNMPIVGTVNIPGREDSVKTNSSTEIEGEVEKMAADAGENGLSSRAMVC